ncbi:MAG: hypothetical protein KC656_29200, partial [Myxococcales bacterium]|nr:hypothetical protein [Myxococcales bacterium]
PSTWWGLEGSLPMLLGLGLSGVPFVGTDVGGYSGDPGPELYARWMALGVISPFFRGHVTQGAPDQEPWALGTEVADLSRDFLQLRSRLHPYLYSLAEQAHQTGAPLLRPMGWAFPDDREVRDLSDQAMLGPWLLAAPVLTEGATTRELRLPEGRWQELWSGAAFQGPTRVVQDVTLAALPLYVREGAILPWGPVRPHVGAPTDEPLVLLVATGPGETTFDLFEDAGDGPPGAPTATTTFTRTGTATGTTLTAARAGTYVPDRDLEVWLRPVAAAPTAVTLDGSALPSRTADAEDASTGWWFDPDDRAVHVRMADPAATFSLVVDHDSALPDLRPPVAVRLTVRAPDGTPEDAVLHVATDADAWATHHPLTRQGDVFTGTVTVPRGRWFRYKYSRGAWCTVEKWPGCEEATDRYAFGASTRPKVDEVFGWRDACPDACR